MENDRRTCDPFTEKGSVIDLRSANATGKDLKKVSPFEIVVGTTSWRRKVPMEHSRTGTDDGGGGKGEKHKSFWLFNSYA